jgi:hypothetical protein
MIYVQCQRCDVIYPANREHVCAQSSKPARKPATRPVEKTVAHSSTSERIEKPPKPAFDRKAYQREYMRSYLPAYRARQKQEKP